jgi:hypothetical protein
MTIKEFNNYPFTSKTKVKVRGYKGWLKIDLIDFWLYKGVLLKGVVSNLTEE